MLSSAILTGILFITIYMVVHNTVFHHLDSDLDAESSEILKSIVVLNNKFVFSNPFEWNESEHGQIEVNPTFIQVVDPSGNLIQKSSNLLNGKLGFNSVLNEKSYFNSSLSGSPVRQLQLPIRNPTEKILGYIIVAMPLEESNMVLNNLGLVLLIGFPFVIVFVFFVSSYIAGKSISPINNVIQTSEKITRENLDKRIELPPHKDEIYRLASTINALLARLQDAVLREKQFTADASHELRTPLSIIKGTLEVLIRKPRNVEQYEKKISYCISEVDRMSKLIDDLLMLARFESEKIKPNFTEIELLSLINKVLLRLEPALSAKSLSINYLVYNNLVVFSDSSMLEIILENIFSNAIKYSGTNKSIEIRIKSNFEEKLCEIVDHGIGMESDQVEKIFDRFYRVDKSRNSDIPGNGLGLAIVKKLADLQKINLKIKSKPNFGTIFQLFFP
jgi:signal transduction histidine kinase